MLWSRKFQLFLFDFDGLLVHTEPLHYQAYVNALAELGCPTSLGFGHFLALAHLNPTAWKEAVLQERPGLDWTTVYERKKNCYLELVAAGKIELMPGVGSLLGFLEAESISRCVVTHSTLNQVELIRSQIPLLKTIPHWLTREDYDNPKPHPECYLRAIELYARPGDRIIGFEDSLRGLKALLGTPALAVLISQGHYPLLEIALGKGALHFTSIADIREPLVSRSV
ncbi:MAG: HAD-superfamily hydrolase [uncultured bacterium]|nr:MAG: HAD-superfamily hydrolase [uncultured bacterium]OGN56335.1 MAG: hypothetical protein A2796_02815 [Chlamydiae bacterium RIFCSPHIGHO2_01_FULL_44_39]OGN58834.1 MAG: hypothetical protein A3C42_06255 [Chlamydiae bacterium RIFCSPHIGHO2_02_FULL_45_9]OGN60273.1 MAG: hypothetical protein A3D96_05525 [Chlamydiae bacterium RIFCSPHIGHO2_12_FULL_44_59]OGN67074.1 MAG: hypothetical protein A2978_00520 [Chlamydiae bacterium RIFCSPLOWO2_01_FULL_44_52]OGN67664.1 MAG: hypothetical protein A3I67_04455 [Ch